MDRVLRRQLIAVVLVALVIVALAWYLLSLPVHYTYPVTRIDYMPTPQSPNFVFSGATPFPSPLTGSVVLKDFTPTSATVAGSAKQWPQYAAALLGRLIDYPFVPSEGGDGVSVTSNTMPAGLTTYTAPLTLVGTGTLWIMRPRRM